MLSGGRMRDTESSLYLRFYSRLRLRIVAAVMLQAIKAISIEKPSSNCYAFDNSSHLHDFTTWIGRVFEHEGKDSDLVIRFCKDVQSRSPTGYFDFGRFDKLNYFATGSEDITFVQEFFEGDLVNCEQSYDKMGRTAQVNILCGRCMNERCKDGLGCICNVTRQSSCGVVVELAIPCENKGPRVFEGFTVGFHPRSWDVVYNGMTNVGFEKAHHQFSFTTQQMYVTLYMTAVASLSSLVQKPVISVLPESGLEVGISGSAVDGMPPTTLSPSVLTINWRCEEARDSLYEVNVTIPIEGYAPMEFTLSKMCKFRQNKGGGAEKGWAMIGVVFCVFFVVSVLFCCGGFFYKTRVEQQHGLDALPGMAVLAACLETLNGVPRYSRAEETNNVYANQASWEHRSSASRVTGSLQGKYGSI